MRKVQGKKLVRLTWKMKRQSMGPQSHIGFLGKHPVASIGMSISDRYKVRTVISLPQKKAIVVANCANIEEAKGEVERVVAKWVYDAGLLQTRGAELTKELFCEVRELKGKGASYGAIEEKLGVSKSTIARIVGGRVDYELLPSGAEG